MTITNPTDTAFSEKLAATLVDRNLSQRTVADRLNLTRASVSDWCRGQSVPAPETVFALERAIEVAPGELSRFLGYLPVVEDMAPPTVLEALATDPALDDVDREIIILIYEKLAGRRRSARRRRR